LDSTPIVKDLVLVGGGHSHVEVIKRFAMRPIPGMRLSVISREVHTPYSGMLPGLIAGHYDFDDVHIDLGPLVRMAGGRLYHNEVTGVDLEKRKINCIARPPVSFDILSIDIGSAPDTRVSGAADVAIPVKPVSNFSAHWQRAKQRICNATGAQHIAVVGSGAGGVELLLAIRHQLRTIYIDAERNPDELTFYLVSASDSILPTHNDRVRRKFVELFEQLNIEIQLNAKVAQVDAGTIKYADSRTLAINEVFWVTTASAPAWPRESGLMVDDNGFIRVHDTLQSVSHSDVFASGDIAAVDDYPRPKSGVFAVRQGPPLTENLRRSVLGKALRGFKPQRDFLSLISTGDKHAIGSRGGWAVEGRWVWQWKDWIDRRFMQKYRELPEMVEEPNTFSGDSEFDTDLHDLLADPMRCGGCGSKVGADILSDALTSLQTQKHDDVLIGLDQPDDAAVVKPHPGTVLVQTIDSFRAFIDDPFTFGKVAANHCLSDIFAMGATPQTALAVVTLPLSKPAKMRDDLVQLMSGAMTVFDAERTAVVGGHTNEGAELALGFAINGYIDPDKLKRKSGAKPGDCLILTKPLGTGVLFAGEMRGKAKSRWIEPALGAMLLSNGPAANCLREFDTQALTDITGFGLIGHLVEMLRAANVGASIDLTAVPFLEGAESLAKDGIRSSLHSSNLRIESVIQNAASYSADERYALCFDPQTSGGLLGAVPANQAPQCLRKLHALGYSASIIGSVGVAPAIPREPMITLS